MKRLICSLLLIFILSGTTIANAATLKLSVNGKDNSTVTMFVSDSGQVYASLDVFKTIGAKYKWDSKASTITVTKTSLFVTRVEWDYSTGKSTTSKDKQILKMTIGKKDAQFNDVSLTLKEAPIIKEKSPYVPISALASFGYRVTYDKAKGSVSIVTQSSYSYYYTNNKDAVLKESKDFTKGKAILKKGKTITINNILSNIRSKVDVDKKIKDLKGTAGILTTYDNNNTAQEINVLCIDLQFNNDADYDLALLLEKSIVKTLHNFNPSGYTTIEINYHDEFGDMIGAQFYDLAAEEQISFGY